MKPPPYNAFLAVAGLMFVQAATGLAFPWIYRDREPWALAAWRGNDVVTLVVTAPALAACALRARRGDRRALLLALGLLYFCSYNDAYYLLGAALGVSFPLYAAIMVTCAATLIASLPRVDAEGIAAAVGPRAPVRAVAGVFALVGAALATVWLAQWAAYVTTGRAPSVGPDAMRLIAAMDLCVIAPTLVAGGVLLWRRHAWGVVVAALGGALGGLYALVLTAGTVAGMRAGIAGIAAQLPLWVALAAVLLSATAALLRHVDRPAAQGERAGEPVARAPTAVRR